METLLLPASDGLDAAADILRGGGVVGMPTETVYGLAAMALDAEAVAGIFATKGRPGDNPLIVHIADAAQADELAQVSPAARDLMVAFWPGPLTLVLPKQDVVPEIVTAGLDSVALRLPSHPVARELISRVGPLAAPSANRSGSPSPTTAAHVVADLSGVIPLVLDGGPCAVGLESTVVSLCGAPTLLRPGFVTLTELEAVVGKVEVSPGVLAQLPEGARAASPGMLHKHYAPKATVHLCLTIDRARALMKQLPGAVFLAADKAYDLAPVLEMGADYAGLYGALRGVDDAGYAHAVVVLPQGDGIGLAARNRLLRAAEFRVE